MKRSRKLASIGNHAVLITGLGPVGLAAGALCRKLGAEKIIGIDISPERRDIAMRLGLCDTVLTAGHDNVNLVRELTGGHGVERAVDCSANAEARATAIRATRKWGKMVMVGEGGTVTFNPSPDIIHDQKTIYGSWVTSTWLMEELVERLVRWNLHPEDIVTHRFTLDQADEAYSLMASGRCGKVAVCPRSGVTNAHVTAANGPSHQSCQPKPAFPRKGKIAFFLVTGSVLSLGDPQQPERCSDPPVHEVVRDHPPSGGAGAIGLLLGYFFLRYSRGSCDASLWLQARAFHRSAALRQRHFSLFPGRDPHEAIRSFLSRSLLSPAAWAFSKPARIRLSRNLAIRRAAVRRLNFSQAFNPLGSICGAMIGTLFHLFGSRAQAREIAQMKAQGCLRRLSAA